VHIDPELRLGEGAARLAYRIVREGLRNVVKHAEAGSALVEIRREEGWVHVLVADDGRGVEGNVEDGELPESEGHLGLRLLRDSVRDAHGHLELAPNRPQGTRLRARFLEDVPGF
jgi:signal transduction histidine kinase